MTFTDSPALAPYTPVTFDLYTNIHKGIRAELFDIVLYAGRIDPAERRLRAGMAARVGQVMDMLVSHAHHEDRGLEAVLAEHLPALGAQIADDHAVLHARIDALRELAERAVGAPEQPRRAVHRLYIELASFTSAYLAHQDFEERTVMPAIEQAVGVPAVIAIHGAIVGAIPPAEMAATLAVMLPAMNVDDRAELLEGMRAGAPAEVFTGVWGLAGSVLAAPDYAALGARLGIRV